MDCGHPLCQDARATSQCGNMLGDDAENIKKLVVRRNSTLSWLIECRRFLKVVLPKQFGGTPGRRTVDAADRGRLTSGAGSEATGTEAGVKITHPTVTGKTRKYVFLVTLSLLVIKNYL